MMIRFRRAPALHDDVYCKLVDQLFGTVGAWTAGVAGGLVMASAGVVIDGRPAFCVLLYALAWLSVVRGCILYLYKKSLHFKTDVRAMRRWEWTYAVPAILWMAVIGADAYVSVTAPSMELRIFASMMAVGITGGIGGRNASRPWIVMAQVVAVLGPYAAGLVELGGAVYVSLLMMTGFMFLGVKSSTQSFYSLLLSAMTTARHNTFLANRLDMALNNMSHGLVMIDRNTRVEVVNDRFKELLGIDPGEAAAGSTLREVIDAACKRRSVLARTVDDYETIIETCLKKRGFETLLLKSALGVEFEFRFHPTLGGGSVIIVEDITEKRSAAAKIERMAHYDDLTGLPNRVLLKSILSDRISAVSSKGAKPFSVLYLDLDHFKQVNDTLGHSVGDMLLTLVSERIKASVRKVDICSRLAGDEFVILQAADGDEDATSHLAERLIQRVAAPYAIDGQEIVVGLTIGIARAGQDGHGAEDLLKQADLALYRAKEQGRGTYCFFQEAMNVAARERRENELDLRHAIANDEISVFFQPITDVATGRVTCCEALVRWQHPTKGMVPPDEFIKLAESTGLIVELSAVVLRKACKEVANWPSHVSVAVNLSAVQFRRNVVIDHIKRALEASDLPAERLEVEITESLALSNLAAVREVVEQIRAMGVKVALDDFGTGYSSLAYIQQIPFDKIKIDRSFVRNLVDDPMSRSLIRLMTSFVRSLDKVLIVEGVETGEQVAILREMGVRYMQGFHFGRPTSCPALDGAARAIPEVVASDAASSPAANRG